MAGLARPLVLLVWRLAETQRSGDQKSVMTETIDQETVVLLPANLSRDGDASLDNLVLPFVETD